VTLDTLGLIEKHRANGLLIDTNLLILYLVGRTNKRRILTFKRTQTYAIEDFDLLERFISNFNKLITTPHVLTEVSNLASLHGKELRALRGAFRSLVEQMKEFFDESQSVVADASFDRLGLTDAAIAMIGRHNLLVLTDDLDLHTLLLRRGVDALNFNHIRPWNWHN
jgi:rRNA-processing protein FCF1